MVDVVNQHIDLGCHAIHAQTGVPGIKDAYGVGCGKPFLELADMAMPSSMGPRYAKNSSGARAMRNRIEPPLSQGRVFC